MNIGGFSRSNYDSCAYEKRLSEQTSPLAYRLYEGAYENCGKCKYENQFWHPFDKEIVDMESELKNITRRLTRCPEFKYNPTCKAGKSCTSTFDASAPIVYAPEVCPIVFNNIPKRTDPGYRMPNPSICGKQ
jgi:hypothetical protein